MNHLIDRRGLIVSAIYAWLTACAITAATIAHIIHRRIHRRRTC